MIFMPNIARAATITVEAENYSSMSGVVKGHASDVSGGLNVGSIDTGDWMTYSVVVPVTASYNIIYRVATPRTTTAKFVLKSGVDVNLASTIYIPATGEKQVWRDIGQIVSLQKGKQTLKVYAQVGGFNLNRFTIEKLPAAPISSARASSVTSKAASSAAAIKPLTVIQAENYSAMSGIYNETTTDVGGGKNTSYINTGDWMEYKNVAVVVPATTKFKITYRVASLSAGGRFAIHAAGGSTIFDTVPVPVTGGWQKWASVVRIVTLPAGKHYFGVKVLRGGFNVNWIKVEPVNQSTTAAASVVTSASASSVRRVSSSSSSKPAIRSSGRSSSSVATNKYVAGPVGITWTIPNRRENGDYLNMNHVGGYEIRYKKIVDADYTYITINDAFQTRYDFGYLEGDYVFQVAAFDKNGLYSQFVDRRPQ